MGVRGPCPRDSRKKKSVKDVYKRMGEPDQMPLRPTPPQTSKRRNSRGDINRHNRLVSAEALRAEALRKRVEELKVLKYILTKKGQGALFPFYKKNLKAHKRQIRRLIKNGVLSIIDEEMNKIRAKEGRKDKTEFEILLERIKEQSNDILFEGEEAIEDISNILTSEQKKNILNQDNIEEAETMIINYIESVMNSLTGGRRKKNKKKKKNKKRKRRKRKRRKTKRRKRK